MIRRQIPRQILLCISRGQFKNPAMRILMIFALAAMGFAASASEIEQQLDLAREAKDTHAEIELLRRWLEVHPNDPGAVKELVALWLSVPDFDMALQTLQQTASPDPGLVARTDAEVALRRDDKIQDALKILHARAEAAPKDRESRLLLAQYLSQAGERQEQIAVLDSLINEQSSVGLLLDRAGAKLAADDPKGALVDFKKAAADGPDDAAVQRVRPSYERLESTLAAVAVLDKLAASPEVHFNKSYFWFSGGVPSRGLAEATEGLRGWPDSVYGKILETRGLVANGTLTSEKAAIDRHVNVNAALDNEKARRGILQADAVLAAKPGDVQALINRASWLNAATEFTLATDDIETALKAAPSNIAALRTAAMISLQRGNFAAATAYAEQLKSLKASRDVLSEVYAGLSQGAFEQSNFALALDFAARSIEAKPQAQVWKLKAACYTRLGQPNEAADALKQAGKGTR